MRADTLLSVDCAADNGGCIHIHIVDLKRIWVGQTRFIQFGTDGVENILGCSKSAMRAYCAGIFTHCMFDLFLGFGIIFERAGKLLSFGLQPHSLTLGRVRTEMRIDMPRAAASENKTFQQ